MKKGQVTIFIIIGIVILFSFVLVFYVSNFISTENLKREQEALTNSPFESAAIHQFSSFCVEDALNDGLVKLGKNGGFINIPQPSLTHTSPVGYGIGPLEGNDPPLYPCLDGTSPAFCRYGYDNNAVTFGTSLLPRREGGAFSIQGQLENHIGQYVQKCIDVDNFAAQVGLSGYTLTAENTPKVNLEFLDTEVIAHLTYPITIQLSGSSSATQFIKYTARTPVRFKIIYDAIVDLAQKDVSNVSFSIAANHATEFFTINSVREREPVRFAQLNPPVSFSSLAIGPDDLYTFTDPASIIKGKEYVFQLARKNRAPALDYIQQNASYRYDRTSPTKNIYDYLAVKGEQQATRIQFTPSALDPDEDAVQYSYSSTLTNSQSTGTNTFNTQTSLIPPGSYNVIVTASDGTTSDSQEIRILLDRPLIVDFTVKNQYGQENIISPEDPFQLDATPTITEPHITLDPHAQHTYQITNAFDAFTGTSDSPCVQLPSLNDNLPPCSSTSNVPPINQITQETTNSGDAWPSLNNQPKSGAITLEVTRTYSDRDLISPTTKQVTIVPCIVHDSTTPPYPYNSNPPNPFTAYDASHACCEGDPNSPTTWKLKSQGETCFTEPRCAESYYIADYVHQCDGIRGNLCGNDPANPPTLTKRTPLTCGESSMLGCSAIPSTCANQESWSIANNVWCYGDTFGPKGCEKACTSGEVVYTGSDPNFQFIGTRFVGTTNHKCGCGIGDIATAKKCFRTDGSGTGSCTLQGFSFVCV